VDGAVPFWLTGRGGGVLLDRFGIELGDAVEAAGMMGFGRRVCNWVAEDEGSRAGWLRDSERSDPAGVGPNDPKTKLEVLEFLPVNLLVPVRLRSVI